MARDGIEHRIAGTDCGVGGGVATGIVWSQGLSALGNQVRGHGGTDRGGRRRLGLCDAFPKPSRASRRRKVMPRGNAAAAGSPSPWRKSPGGFSKPNEEKRPGKNPTVVANNAARLFFPHSRALGIAPDDTASPVVLRKMVYAGSHASSFEQASKDLKEEAELEISAAAHHAGDEADRPRARRATGCRSGGVGKLVVA